jgi:hypothetical protein
MTPALLVARSLIVHCFTLWLATAEYAFDMIESELDRRGVDLQETDSPSYTMR